MPKREVRLYVKHAHQMLEVAEHNLVDGFYGSAINRAYNAVFYAANALLATKGISRSKHSGVIAAFRQYFVKPGMIEVEHSDVYGRVMDNRHVSDYEIGILVDASSSHRDLQDARRFVLRIEQFLEAEGWL